MNTKTGNAAAADYDASASRPRFAAVETRSIDYVPNNERHGRVADQGPFWFLGNFQFFTIAIGFVGPGMGLSLGWTVLAGALGILFGTLFMAFHASQGAQLGLPQMIQSRAQFGYRGVVVVLLATAFTFIGFNVVDTVLMADGLHALFGWSPVAITIATALLALALAVYGHDWLHRTFKWLLVASLPLYLLLSFAIVTGHIPAKVVQGGTFSLVAFASQFAASASYNITYAPYVSDYSRYLPSNTRPRSIIAAVFAGASSSAIWLIALGAWLASRLGATDGLIALNSAGNAIFHGFGALISVMSVVAMVATMGLNAYSAMLTLITGVDSFRPVRPTRKIRVVTLVILTAIWVVVSMMLKGNAIDILFAALTMMLYLLVPWTAINLVDYFFIRRGEYAITHMFTADGVYGAWGVRGLVAYVTGFVCAIPFFVLPGVYTGPLAHKLGDVDVAWLVGLIVGTLVYLLPRRTREAQAAELAAIEESNRALNAG